LLIKNRELNQVIFIKKHLSIILSLKRSEVGVFYNESLTDSI